ncbi:hypothetical protein T484DRAFT_1859844 [Baffinella frigidus]|nr:hypothetical protein T484DRAFT_1859844 [Cryptophyta sp. CCMP2293]
MAKALLAAACLAFLGAASAVTLDKVTSDTFNFNYQGIDPSSPDYQNFEVVSFKLKFSGEIKIQKGAEEAIYLEQFPKDEQNFMVPFLSGGLDVTLKCGPNDELSITTKQPADADTFPKEWLYPVAPQPEFVGRIISTILGGIPPIFAE